MTEQEQKEWVEECRQHINQFMDEHYEEIRAEVLERPEMKALDAEIEYLTQTLDILEGRIK